MLKLFLCEVINTNRRKDILVQAGYYFTRPFEELDKEIREILKSPPTGPYTRVSTTIHNIHFLNILFFVNRTFNG